MNTVAPGREACAVYILTTCHLANDGLEDLTRLVASVRAAVDEGEVGQLRLMALLQGCSTAECSEAARAMPQWVELLPTEASLSSPAARNFLIVQLLEKADFDPTAVAAFPDDDAWYPPGALRCIKESFAERRDSEFLITRRGPRPSAEECSSLVRPSLQTVLSNASCNTIFLRRRLLDRLPGFDERLGLGTVLAGGEDTEFAIRAFNLARDRTLYVHSTLVGHSVPDGAKKAKYYEGGLAAILAHSNDSLAGRLALIRKIAVGLWWVATMQLSTAKFCSAIRRARANAPAVRSRNSIPETRERARS